jgi:hypothetical protein
MMLSSEIEELDETESKEGDCLKTNRRYGGARAA